MEYSVAGNCTVDLTLERLQAYFKMGDDGSTVIFAVTIYSVEGESNIPELHCIDGQIGNAILSFSLRISNGGKSVNVSRWRLHSLR